MTPVKTDFSVVIPTYNRSRLLPRALASVFRQSLLPREVIVVDDGSTDRTEDMVRERFPACQCVRQSHRGVSSARNLGIRTASCDWVALLDSDDEWLPGKLAAQAAALEAAPGHGLCHTEEIWIRGGKRVNPMLKHAKAGGFIFQRCLPLCVISPSSAVIHRSVFDHVGLFDESLPACEDYDLWLRVCARYPVLFIPTPQIVKHGGHEDQLSGVHWGMDRFRIRALEKIAQDVSLPPVHRASAIGMLLEKLRIYAKGADKRGHSAVVAECLRKQRNYLDLLGVLRQTGTGEPRRQKTLPESGSG